MTRTTFFTLAAVLLPAGLLAGGCAGDDGEGQLAQSSPRATPHTEPAPAESSNEARSRQSEPTRRSRANSSPGRIGRQQARELRFANEKLRKRLGVPRGPKAAEGCVNIQGDPGLTRLIEANGRCKRQDAPGPDAAPPSMEVPSPTDPRQP
jgi:hypothetical protein